MCTECGPGNAWQMCIKFSLQQLAYKTKWQQGLPAGGVAALLVVVWWLAPACHKPAAG